MPYLSMLLLVSMLLLNQPVLGECPKDSTACGYYGQLCCAPGQTCATNSNNEAECIVEPNCSPSSSSNSCSAFCGMWGQVTETVIWSTMRVYSTFAGTGCVATASTTTVTVISTSISTTTITSPPLQGSTEPTTSIPASTSAQLPVCPLGWFTCGKSQGEGCCPVGYECTSDNQCAITSGSSSNSSTSCTTSISSIICNYSLNESPCGKICCSSGQYCYAVGSCKAAGSAPLRPTGSSTTFP
jgi:hypothetical protein